MESTQKRKLSYEQKVLYIFLLVVVFVVFILPFLIPGRKHPITEYMCRASCKSNLKNIAFHCKMYKDDNGTFPGSFLDLDRNKYLIAGRVYVCYHYFAYNVSKVVDMENKNSKKLLYTSYDYLGPDGEYEPSLKEMILIREKVYHPSAEYKSLSAGYHVVTKNLEVKFISTTKEKDNKTDSSKD